MLLPRAPLKDQKDTPIQKNNRRLPLQLCERGTHFISWETSIRAGHGATKQGPAWKDSAKAERCWYLFGVTRRSYCCGMAQPTSPKWPWHSSAKPSAGWEPPQTSASSGLAKPIPNLICHVDGKFLDLLRQRGCLWTAEWQVAVTGHSTAPPNSFPIWNYFCISFPGNTTWPTLLITQHSAIAFLACLFIY